MLGPDGRLFVLADLARQLVVFDVEGLLSGGDLTTRLLSEISLVAEEKLSPEVLRGKQLFANADDRRMSSEGYLSCASCHLDGFEDGQVWDFFDRGEGSETPFRCSGAAGPRRAACTGRRTSTRSRTSTDRSVRIKAASASYRSPSSRRALAPIPSAIRRRGSTPTSTRSRRT